VVYYTSVDSNALTPLLLWAPPSWDLGVGGTLSPHPAKMWVLGGGVKICRLHVLHVYMGMSWGI